VPERDNGIDREQVRPADRHRTDCAIRGFDGDTSFAPELAGNDVTDHGAVQRMEEMRDVKL